MSNITIIETCLCGARYEGTGYMSYIMTEADKFREAHAVCREREPYRFPDWLVPTGPPTGEEE